MNRVANERDRMACVASDELDGDQRKCGDDGHSQRDGHAFRRKRSVRMSAEPVAVTVSMVVAGMGMSRGALRVVVHQLDFNRDSRARTATIQPTCRTALAAHV